MNFSYFKNDVLSALRGQFSPDQFGARLFMFSKDIMSPENYLVWFHERYHYLQSIFTPYGHLKWGAYRTVTADVISAWVELPKVLNCDRRIPIADYVDDKSPENLKIAATIWFHNMLYQLYSIVEQGNANADIMKFTPQLSQENICPEIELFGSPYRFKGLDIFESFAKFQEAVMAELITGKSLDESIDPAKLNPEYYSALYYFITEVGAERLKEFPIACELSLSTPHIPSPHDKQAFYENAPNWRFINIVATLKKSNDLPALDFSDHESFYAYANTLLSRCGYPTLDGIWDACESYAMQTDLSMAQEMKAAIEYKKSHPWMLSYPMYTPEFATTAFNRFEPYYTITDDSVFYNIANISSSELIFENNFQAIAAQVCGKVSPYCLDRTKLMCGDSYMGTKNCPHYKSGECDGHIDKESILPELLLDESGNVNQGCLLELTLKIMDISIKDINIGQIRALSFDQLNKVTHLLKQ